jgi:hypothetical protein
MRSRRMKLFYSCLTAVGMVLAIRSSQAADRETPVPSVQMTVTASVAHGKRMPDIDLHDVHVRHGNERLEVTDWAPAKGARAGLDLFILIDDASDPRLGSQLDALRTFINGQPATTRIGVGYIRNATLQVAQQFTTDHAQAANALRLPLGSPGAYSSPYLSVVDLMKRWPESTNRREVLMITDGIDRARRSSRSRRGFISNPDVDTATSVAQRTGTMIHTIYAPGVGRYRRTYWEQASGQMNAARLSYNTGGESFFLGLQGPVSITPYLDELQEKMDNQYLLSFVAKPGKKAGLQSVSLSTDVAGVELSTHDAVWVPASK